MHADLARLAAALCVSLLVSSCGGGDSGSAQNVLKSTQLNGAQETPAVTTIATGSARLAIDMASGSISATVTTSNIDATAAHIHEGPVGTAGPIILPLEKGADGAFYAPANSRLTAAQLDSLRNGNLYVNVHTAVNPNGEIRGQIGRQVFFATLTAAQETPATTSTATGTGVFVFDPETSKMSGTVASTGVAGTVGHIHVAPVGTAAPAAIPFTGGPANWTMPETVLTAEQVASLAAGNFYANVHSAANPGGEIRGQLYIPVRTANLSGSQEVPPNSSAGTGSGVFVVNPFTRAIAGKMTWSGVVATDAHIHNAAPGISGGIVIRGTVTAGDRGQLDIASSTPLADNLLTAFIVGNLYYNVHSAAFPPGEIRGQLTFVP